MFQFVFEAPHSTRASLNKCTSARWRPLAVLATALWIAFLAFVLLMLAVDLGIFNRKDHVVGFREALTWSGVWVFLVLVFNAIVWLNFGAQRGIEFLTGYLIEKSVSIDNIFVFVVIFARQTVEPRSRLNPAVCDNNVGEFPMPTSLELTTPALLFPAVSLLFLAYTNRFLVLAQLVRQLHGNNRVEVHDIVVRQIHNLKIRIGLMKTMQLLAVISFILCSLSMTLMYFHSLQAAHVAFGLSLFALTASLVVSLYEVWLSTGAIELELSDMER